MLTELAAQPCAAASRARDLEARLLADLLRLSRVTVLYGAASAGKTTLLKTGVLPLLCRRHDDRGAADRAHPRVVPFPERRRGAGRAGGRGEVAVFFDSWGEDPLGRLQKCLLEALPPVGRHAGLPSSSLSRNLAIWHDELGLRFFIILDAFEAYLQAPEHESGILEFAHELVRLLNEPLRVNLLIALRDDAQPLLEQFRASVPGFDDASFHLPALQHDVVAAKTIHEEAHAHAAAQSIGRASGMIDVLATQLAAQTSVLRIESTDAHLSSLEAPEPPVADESAPAQEDPEPLARIGRADEFTRAVEPLRPAAAVPEALNEPSAGPFKATPDTATTGVAHCAGQKAIAEEVQATGDSIHPAADFASPQEATPPPSALKSPKLDRGRTRKRLAAVALAAALVLGVWVFIEQVRDGPAAPTVAVATRAAVTPAQEVAEAAPPALRPSLPQLALVTEFGNSTDAIIAADVARTIGPDAGMELLVQNDGVFWEQDTMPRLALVRYETLEARRRAKPDASAGAFDNVRVIAPLYTEEIHFIVRRDSSLQYIHEIRDARINVGPARSARGMTAARLYQGMFGVAQPAEFRTSFDDDEALRRLLDGSIDAMMVVAAQPAKWLLDLPSEVAHSLRLLKLEPSHPLSQNAVQYYLPAVVLASSYRNWLPEDTSTLATMSFLVTPNDREPAFVERLEIVARSLCRNLPELRRAGHPKWIEVEPTLEVDTGWPYSGRARAAFQSCLPERAPDSTVVRSR